jgi:hypothetical protein
MTSMLGLGLNGISLSSYPNIRRQTRQTIANIRSGAIASLQRFPTTMGVIVYLPMYIICLSPRCHCRPHSNIQERPITRCGLEHIGILGLPLGVEALLTNPSTPGGQHGGEANPTPSSRHELRHRDRHLLSTRTPIGDLGGVSVTRGSVCYIRSNVRACRCDGLAPARREPPRLVPKLGHCSGLAPARRKPPLGRRSQPVTAPIDRMPPLRTGQNGSGSFRSASPCTPRPAAISAETRSCRARASSGR